MFKINIKPRFADTDALGHINNTVLPVWFEEGREPIFRFFVPDLDIKKWNLIIAKIEVSFKKQIFYGKQVEVRTYIKKIGNSSLIIGHEAWQLNEMCAIGEAVLIHFDHQIQKKIEIPNNIRKELEKHL